MLAPETGAVGAAARPGSAALLEAVPPRLAAPAGPPADPELPDLERSCRASCPKCCASLRGLSSRASTNAERSSGGMLMVRRWWEAAAGAGAPAPAAPASSTAFCAGASIAAASSKSVRRRPATAGQSLAALTMAALSLVLRWWCAGLGAAFQRGAGSWSSTTASETLSGPVPRRPREC